MNRKELTEYAAKVAHTLKDELPKKGMSLMITSDGEGAVVCHMMGRPDRFIEVIARTLANSEQIFEYVKLAVTGAELLRDIKSAKVEVVDLTDNDDQKDDEE